MPVSERKRSFEGIHDIDPQTSPIERVAGGLTIAVEIAFRKDHERVIHQRHCVPIADLATDLDAQLAPASDTKGPPQCLTKSG